MALLETSCLKGMGGFSSNNLVIQDHSSAQGSATWGPGSFETRFSTVTGYLSRLSYHWNPLPICEAQC